MLRKFQFVDPLPKNDDNMDIDDVLNKEAIEHKRDQEIDRILNTFALDAYSVLDLQPGCTSNDIKKQYRSKSLLIHPDKTSNKQAPDAFDRLKKAEAELQDDKKREVLDQVFTDARRMLIAEKKWTIHDERLKSEDFLKEWREKTKDVLIEKEVRRRKLEQIQMEEEGRLKRQQEEEADKKRKRVQNEKQWEDSRDKRVDSWRSYQKNQDRKKKKKKVDVLG